MNRYYHICRSCVGRPVRIRTRDGHSHVGRISRVTPHHVYLTPFGRGISASDQKKSTPVGTTADTSAVKENASEVLWGAGIIPLAAIVGLTLVGTAPFWGGGYGARGVYRHRGVGRPGFW